MPIYEYVCTSCQHKFEHLRPLSRADDFASCPQCHNGSHRVFSVFASFTKGAEGSLAPVAGTAHSCSACSGTSCSNCN